MTYRAEARQLLDTRADLRRLIVFARSHDPTGRLRAEWGTAYDARLQAALAAVDAAPPGVAHAGGDDAVLLCMAHCVATAPYTGAPEEQVEARLHGLLARLAQEGT